MTKPKQIRQAITRRFTEAFKALEAEGRISTYSRGDKTDNIGEVAAILYGNSGYAHLLRNTLNGKRQIQIDEAMAFCAHYNVSQNWLFNGTGQPFPSAGGTVQDLPGATAPPPGAVNMQPLYDLGARFIVGLCAMMHQNEVRRLFLTAFQDRPLGGTLARIVKNAAETHIGTEALNGNGTAGERIAAVDYVRKSDPAFFEKMFQALTGGKVKFQDLTAGPLDDEETEIWKRRSNADEVKMPILNYKQNN